MGALGQCTHWTRTPFRSSTKNSFFGIGGGAGKTGGQLRCPLRSWEKSVAEPLRYAPNPVDMIGEGRLMLCYVQMKHLGKFSYR